MLGAGALALSGGTGGAGLVHPEEGVTLGGPNSCLHCLQGWHQGNGARLFIVMCGWTVRNNRH